MSWPRPRLGSGPCQRPPHAHDGPHARRRRGVRPQAAESAISVEGLVKAFGDVRALDGVDLSARPGTVLGLLGPNGAGKTTCVRVLTTLLRPDAGTVRVAGLDVVRDATALRRRIGLAGQYAAVDENLTGQENLVMVGRLYGERRPSARARADELLEQFDLVDAGRRPAKTYSGGMRRRLDLAAALVARPPVLFLDEPTTGLDPRSRLELWARSRGSSPTAPRSCSPPSTSTRPTAWPTPSRSSTTAASSPRARPTR
jgi:ABC-type Na+ transport system ATPase subunit NatA